MFQMKSEENGRMGAIIEEAACACFGVDTDDLRPGRRTDRKFTDCLHFVWYFRHYIEGAPVSSLSRAYGRTPRNIFAAISKIDSGTRTQSYYRDLKETIFTEMKRGALRQSECPPGKKE